MCGISGVFLESKANKKNLAELKAAITKMNKSQASRGPDDEGISVFENGVFGHRRLSILDLSKAGHQPMLFKRQAKSDKRQELIISFNGEIYNFLELCDGLKKKGYKFKTKTDTEVILALYAEYGEKSFGMLRGMFAFGLWDGKNNKLFLVKDRYGIKPLYYYIGDGKLVFSSTVKAISESGLITAEKNPQALIGFLLFGSVPLPYTTLKNVLAVPAGHYLVVDKSGGGKIIKYYDPLDSFMSKGANFLAPEGGIVSEVKKRLEESVNLHLISDAPLGVFLSGGLDSSAIAALAAEALRKGGAKNKITTLSVIFDEKEFSEKKYQQMVVEKINSDHREIKITKNDFQDSFDKIFEAMDQPTIDGVNSFFIAEAAKKAGVKTVLSGLGSDEIFLGYSHFKKAEAFKNIQKLPELLKNPLSILSFFGGKYSKAGYFARNDILSFYLGLRGLFAPRQTAEILGANLSEIGEFLKLIIENYQLSNAQLSNLHPANLFSYLELKFYLQNQLLKDADFMSMRHSIEVRVPFLDHPLVEYLSGLTPTMKMGKKINKPLLVAAVKDLLPEEIFTRPKMGFTFPFQKWLGDSQNMSLRDISRRETKYKIQNTKTHWSREWAKLIFDKFKQGN